MKFYKNIVLYFIIFIFTISSYSLSYKNVFSSNNNMFFVGDIFQLYAKLCQMPTFFVSKVLHNSGKRDSRDKGSDKRGFYKLGFFIIPISFILVIFSRKKVIIFHKRFNVVFQAHSIIDFIFLFFIKKILKTIYETSRVKGDYSINLDRFIFPRDNFSLGFFYFMGGYERI